MADEPAVCRAGVRRVRITPDLPCEMAGYFHSRVAQSVARDLYAGVMAFEKDGQKAVVVATDLIAMIDEICLPAFERAGREHGVPLAQCMACATHTHTGPEVRPGAKFPRSEEYIAKTAQTLSDAVSEALGDMFDAVLCVGATQAPGLAFNRLSRCADGSEIFGRQSRGVPVIGPAGPEDHSVQTLAVYDLEKNLRTAAVNFACHPDTAGGGKATAIDADWPGEMAEHLMRVWGEDAAFMLLQGTAGDINNRRHRGAAQWLPDGRPSLARGVAGAALYAMETAAPLADVSISGHRRELDVPYYVRDEALFQLAESLKQKGEDMTYFEKNLVQRIENWTKDGQSDRFGISCLRIGDLAIAAMPGEIFTGWGLEVKRYSPAKHTFVVELASSHDGLTGYKPTSDQALRGARGIGAYGALPTLSQKHCPAAGQMMTEAAIAMLYELWPEAL